jgi:hypothetical protein
MTKMHEEVDLSAQLRSATKQILDEAKMHLVAARPQPRDESEADEPVMAPPLEARR